MITFDFEGQRVTVPTSWSEVTVEHFIMPEFLSGDALKLLSALSGIPLEKLANTKGDYTEQFNKTVHFLNANPGGWAGGEKPDKFMLLNKPCKIPKDIELETFGQKIMMGQVIASNEFVYSAMPEAIAIYLGPQVFPKDWYNRIDEIAKEVLRMKISQVYPVAAFFLSLSKEFRKSGPESRNQFLAPVS